MNVRKYPIRQYFIAAINRTSIKLLYYTFTLSHCLLRLVKQYARPSTDWLEWHGHSEISYQRIIDDNYFITIYAIELHHHRHCHPRAGAASINCCHRDWIYYTWLWIYASRVWYSLFMPYAVRTRTHQNQKVSGRKSWNIFYMYVVVVVEVQCQLTKTGCRSTPYMSSHFTLSK